MFAVSHAVAAPAITSFTPTFGANVDPGFITIKGSGFSGGTLVVKFNGVTDTSAGAVDDQTIQAHVPAGATNGSNPIFVSVNGVGTFSANDFTVIGPGPFVTGFNPPNGGDGAAVTITGVHFSSPAVVRFNGVIASAGTPSPTQIIANAPNGVTTGPISVQTLSGTHTSFSNFFVPPTITNFFPVVGRTGTNVLIRGRNFTGASSVRFNNQEASFSVLSNFAIQATVPVNASAGIIRVTTPGGSFLTSSNFLIAPSIDGFTPFKGPVGTPVTINGANLNFNPPPTVRFNGIVATVSNINFSNLVAVVPPGATTGPITVSNTAGFATSITNFYLPPRITSFTPNNSPPGSLVVVSGTNFIDTSSVTFDGTPAIAFYVSNNLTLGAFVPLNVTTGPISVTTPGGTTNSSARFYGPPSILTFNPISGLPGTNVIISGSNFLDASAVRFNGLNASFGVLNNNTIQAVVPTNATTGPISVVAPAGTNTSLLNFTLNYTANLSVNTADSPDPITVGSNFVINIVVQNAGPFPAPDVTLTDTLIGPATLVSASTTQGTLNTNTFPFTGNLGQINSGNTVVVSFTVKALEPATITNIVSVTTSSTDPVLSNNSATNTTLAQTQPILSVHRSGANVRITWPASLNNYNLEFKTNVTSTDWVNFPIPPIIVGANNQVTDTNRGPRYYRLRVVP